MMGIARIDYHAGLCRANYSPWHSIGHLTYVEFIMSGHVGGRTHLYSSCHLYSQAVQAVMENGRSTMSTVVYLESLPTLETVDLPLLSGQPPAAGESPNDNLAWREYLIAERRALTKDDSDRVEHPQPVVAQV